MSTSRFVGPDVERGETPEIGVVLANLGTPDAPTPAAVRRYLREFLGDPRVVELPRLLWWPILHLFVLPFRPRRSAALYRAVWTEEGSPLLAVSRRQRAALEERLRRRVGARVDVELGMVYGSPSIAGALTRLRRRGCPRVLVLPAYPQYSGTTTGSALDRLFGELGRWRWIPELRTVTSYHDDPEYIGALARSIRELWRADGEPDRLLLSFHGIPRRYADHGDPYHHQCLETARLVAERLDLDDGRMAVAFQSRFGREEWVGPATDATVRELAGSGVDRLDVVCPGFAADCLETLEEIDVRARELFVSSGGGSFRYVPCLNDRDDHIRALASLVERHLEGWLAPGGRGRDS